MAQSYLQIGRTVTYWKSGRKPRPAVVTGRDAVSGNPILRVGHHGETYAPVLGVPERVNRTDTAVWSVR